MQKKLDAAADLCRMMFLITAVSVLWGVEAMFERNPESSSLRQAGPRSGRQSA